MEVLVLGGSDFLGRHIVETALARGHRVTTFNRGRTNPGLFGNTVEKRIGDRGGDLNALREGEWQAVFDTSGYFPEHVHASVRLLADRIAHYSFISSLSVYRNPLGPNHEDAPLYAPMSGNGAPVTGETYGPLKVACEQRVAADMDGRFVVARAGFLVGPYDNVPRFPYWLRRIARGGRILAPGHHERLAQLIDARDAAEFLITCAERETSGIFNLTGEPGAITLGSALETCRDVTGTDAEFVWASDETLEREKVPLLDGLPYWVPEAWQGFMRTPIERAKDAGFRIRPLSETVRAAWSDFAPTAGEEPPHRTSLNGLEIVCGIAPETERGILERMR